MLGLNVRADRIVMGATDAGAKVTEPKTVSVDWKKYAVYANRMGLLTV